MAAGHYLAAQIGAQQLADGGNAFDAACAMGFALQVLEPTQNGPAGEAPMLIFDAKSESTFAVSGQGPAPAAASIETMRGLGIELIPPDGLLSAAIPAAIDAWCRLLAQFGTRRFVDVAAPARALAGGGFPMYPFLHVFLKFIAPRFESEWPTSAAVYLPLREIGERQTNPALADFFDQLIDAERDAPGGRESGIEAARNCFYQGAPAEAIERFLEKPVRDVTGDAHTGLLTAHDLAGYQGRVEEPASASYRGTRVFKTGPWGQGPVFLQQLKLLEGFDLAALGSASADALHTWLEVAKLAFADREACYGDPLHVDVPLDTLLSAAYAEQRRPLVDPAAASSELRPGLGALPEGWPLWSRGSGGAPVEPQAIAAAQGRSDTTQLVAADRFGNVISVTPSGGWIPTSPIVPELGFPIGTRLQMAVLDPDHPNALAPGKRPRTTLSPSLAELPDGRRVAFGTPGGDQQDQWTSQFFLNVVDFGFPDLQSAIDAPTVHSEHMPSSFFPRRARARVVSVETRFDPAKRSPSSKRAATVLERKGEWAHGRVLADSHDPARSLL